MTIPFKEEIIPLLQQVNPRAEAMGAVNVIMKKGSDLIGNNTDWYGFSMAIIRNKIEFDNRSGADIEWLIVPHINLTESKPIYINPNVSKTCLIGSAF